VHEETQFRVANWVTGTAKQFAALRERLVDTELERLTTIRWLVPTCFGKQALSNCIDNEQTAMVTHDKGTF
jgi:hypothetical protein